MRRFFYGNISQDGDNLPTITGSGDFCITVEQAAIEVTENVFENVAGSFFLRSDGNFVEGQCGVIFQTSQGAYGYPNGIYTNHDDTPNRIAFFTVDENGTPRNEIVKGSAFIAWTDVEVE